MISCRVSCAGTRGSTRPRLASARITTGVSRPADLAGASEQESPAARATRLRLPMDPRSTPGILPRVPPRLGKKESALRSQDVVKPSEASHGIVHSMDNGKQQSTVDLANGVRDAERAGSAWPRLDPGDHACAACPTEQRVQRVLLEVRAEYSTAWTNESRQGQAEEPHGRPDIQNAHPWFD